jgi:hypothetical protein
MEVTLNNFSKRNYLVKTIKATIHCNAFSVNWLMPHLYNQFQKLPFSQILRPFESIPQFYTLLRPISIFFQLIFLISSGLYSWHFPTKILYVCIYYPKQLVKTKCCDGVHCADKCHPQRIPLSLPVEQNAVSQSERSL